MKNIRKIKGNTDFLNVLTRLFKFGIIGKLVKSSVTKFKNLTFCKSRQDVPFVVLGHKYFNETSSKGTFC